MFHQDAEVLYYPTVTDSPIVIGDTTYPDGMSVFNSSFDEVFERYVYDVSSLVVRPKSVGALMGALFFADACAWRGWPIGTLVIPYLPGARQDRMNPKGDFLFGAKSIANEINARGFAKVICFDPHSEVMPALIDNCVVIHVDETEALVGDGTGRGCYDGVVAPDAGAGKRAERIAKALKLPVINAWKTRDVASGNSKITGFGIEPIVGVQKLLIVDDICDGGGTFIGLADHIKSLGSSYEIEMDLYVSHGLFSKGIDALVERFGRITTTNSIAYDPNDFDTDKLHRVDILTEILAERAITH